MAHFYGTLRGQRGEASRLGSKTSGITTYTASWAGAINCRAYIKDGIDWVEVEMVPWQGRGTRKTLYHGPIGEYKPMKVKP